ncbi:MAG: long-chain fatty acid--CoA ligase [Candidatus Krumholzibacteria bacterium]|nr:long-chain fatty acid--CoA ligase [Candidatus Krumholzibacteria bacterium]
MSIQSIPELFLASVREHPRPDCFSYRDESGQYVDVSSEEALRRVKALRFGLRSLGVQPGDRVAILSENRIEWALADLAGQCAGGVIVPIYPTLLDETIEYILKDCEPVAIFVSNQDQAQKIHNIRERLPFLKDVISFERTNLPDIMIFEKLKQIGQNLVDDNPPAPRDECLAIEKDAPCSIIYTSGTTGNPKGVVLSHWNFVSNVLHIRSLMDFKTDDRCLSFLPLSHVLERMAGFYSMLYCGVGIAYADRMDTVPVDVLDVKPTIMVSVPRLYEKIYAKAASMSMGAGFPKKNIFFWARNVGIRCAEIETAGQKVGGMLAFQRGLADKLVFGKLRAKLGGRIRFMVSGGAPLNAKINKFFYGSGMLVLEGYGLTETSPVLTCNNFGAIRFGSVGKAIAETDIKIAEDGEILCRGPQVMLGYFNNDAATGEVLSPEGWLSTGDIGHLDEDGYLFITDRKKDLIVTAGGKNIAPQPIENAFATNKHITQMVVIGDKRQFLSCLIVPDFEVLREFANAGGLGEVGDEDLLKHPAVNTLFEGILEALNRDLAGFSQIRKFTLLPREFTLEDGELTPTMKVKRFAINKKYEDVIAAMYPAPLPGEEI